MCLLAFAFHMRSDAPLIVISNRDEFYERPTLPMHWWDDEAILAGRDQKAKGTWLGMAKNGRFAAVTNFRDIRRNAMPQTKPCSRGELVTGFLSSTKDVHQWASSLNSYLSDYDGFNLIIFDGITLLYVNNQGDPAQVIEPGVYALSNHRLDSPWPKVDYAREQLERVLSADTINQATLPTLINTLALEKTYAPHLLPDTGITAEWEALLSSPFIVSEGYGTRAATAIIISPEGKVSVAEQGFENGEKLGFNQFDYQILGN